VLFRFYQTRIYLAWSNRCWRCLTHPFHGSEDAASRRR
jgi:hypothetical protein